MSNREQLESPGTIRLAMLHDHLDRFTEEQQGSFRNYLMGCLASVCNDQQWETAIDSAEECIRRLSAPRLL